MQHVFSLHRTTELLRSRMINHDFPVIMLLQGALKMTYLIIAYIFGCVAYTLPYVIRYFRILKHESAQNQINKSF